MQVFAADTLGFRGLGFDQSLDFDLALPGLFVKADVALSRLVAVFAVIKPCIGLVVGVFGAEFVARGEDLFHVTGWRRWLSGCR